MTVVEIDAQKVQALLSPLWQKNRPCVLERLARVRTALVEPNGADELTNARVHNDIHALIGTLGTYGWPSGSRLVEQIDDHLQDADPPDREELVRRLDELTAALTEA